jgi:hypothetical protein
MKRRSFISLLIAGLCALGLMRRREKPFRFFWVDEDSEIFVARDLDALNDFLGRGREHALIIPKSPAWPDGAEFFDELLTPENEGEVWGEVGSDGLVNWSEEGTDLITYEQALARFMRCPWFQAKQVTQIATSYT